MSYNPEEHAVAGRQVLAGWVICLVVVGLALGLTTRREPAPAAASAETRQIAAMVGHAPLSGAHIPRFVQCCSRLDKRLLAMAEMRSTAASSPIGSCG